jgi:hypothetical protein
MRQASSLLAAGLLAFGLAGAAQAQVFKCVDSSGKTVYSQSPCPKDAKSSTIQRSVPPAVPAAAAAKGDATKSSGPKTAAELDQEFRKRRKEQEDAQKKSQESETQAREKAENCTRARAALAGLEQSGRQMRLDEKGERVFLDEAGIEQEKDRARKTVQANCG